MGPIYRAMSTKKTWGIIGLGWLGQALAQQLQSSGAKVWGTRTDTFVFGEDPFPTQAADVIFLNTPPILDLTPEQFVAEIALTEKQKLIFISSTSVYGPKQKFCTEDVEPQPWTSNGKWLFEVESLLLKNFKKHVLIIRPGGLIGDKRHPVFSLAKADEISGGLDPINLIHRDDLIGVILKSEELGKTGLINAVTPFHPAKHEYYNHWASKLNLPKINFNNDYQSAKVVDSKILPSIYKTWRHPKLDGL